MSSGTAYHVQKSSIWHRCKWEGCNFISKDADVVSDHEANCRRKVAPRTYEEMRAAINRNNRRAARNAGTPSGEPGQEDTRDLAELVAYVNGPADPQQPEVAAQVNQPADPLPEPADATSSSDDEFSSPIVRGSRFSLLADDALPQSRASSKAASLHSSISSVGAARRTFRASTRDVSSQAQTAAAPATPLCSTSISSVGAGRRTFRASTSDVSSQAQTAAAPATAQPHHVPKVPDGTRGFVGYQWTRGAAPAIAPCSPSIREAAPRPSGFSAAVLTAAVSSTPPWCVYSSQAQTVAAPATAPWSNSISEAAPRPSGVSASLLSAAVSAPPPWCVSSSQAQTVAAPATAPWSNSGVSIGLLPSTSVVYLSPLAPPLPAPLVPPQVRLLFHQPVSPIRPLPAPLIPPGFEDRPRVRPPPLPLFHQPALPIRPLPAPVAPPGFQNRPRVRPPLLPWNGPRPPGF